MVLSCEEDEPPLPPPIAAFSTNTEIPFFYTQHVAEPKDVIIFTNTSTDASTYLWDFGDGSTSTEVNPIHIYLELGEYNIELIATNENGDFSVANGIIVVAPRAIADLFISRIDFFKPNGEPWDVDSPPDILFFMGEVNNPGSAIIIALPRDLSAIDFPFGGGLFIEDGLSFTDTDWFFILIENDAPMDTFDENDEYMFGDVLNPTKVGRRNIAEEGGGTFGISSGQDALGNETDKFGMNLKWFIRL